MAYILLVEDDIHISDFIVKGLKESGHTVEHCDNSDSADTIVEMLEINIAIVDIMLKGRRTGLDMVEKWRKDKITIPVIFLSARDRVEDKLKGFEIGGDDYLSKPFSFSELKARIESLLRRLNNKVASNNEYQYHGLILNLRSHQVKREGKVITLQRREYMLLEYFMENPEQVLGKMMILERVWGFNFDPQTNVVDVLISRLRNKVDKNFKVKLIHTIRGMGYVLKAQ